MRTLVFHNQQSKANQDLEIAKINPQKLESNSCSRTIESDCNFSKSIVTTQQSRIQSTTPHDIQNSPWGFSIMWLWELITKINHFESTGTWLSSEIQPSIRNRGKYVHLRELTDSNKETMYLRDCNYKKKLSQLRKDTQQRPTSSKILPKAWNPFSSIVVHFKHSETLYILFHSEKFPYTNITQD